MAKSAKISVRKVLEILTREEMRLYHEQDPKIEGVRHAKVILRAFLTRQQYMDSHI